MTLAVCIILFGSRLLYNAIPPLNLKNTTLGQLGVPTEEDLAPHDSDAHREWIDYEF